MKTNAVIALARALEEHDVRYIVVGGLAVVAHGYVRFTADVDLVIQLKPANVKRAFEAFESIGYKPMIPVTAQQFASARERNGWIRDKGMLVLKMFSDRHEETIVDVFVKEPFDFDRCYKKSEVDTLEAGVSFRFADVRTLIQLKRAAGRPKDLDDIEHLKPLLPTRKTR